jgi:nitrile hydratase
VPGYALGKEGVILHRTTEKWPFPDAIGHGDRSAEHQPTYHVQFKVKDLWGDAAGDGFVVVDLFESYLDKAPQARQRAQSTNASVSSADSEQAVMA